MTPKEMFDQLHCIESAIDEMHDLALEDVCLCNLDNGKCINFILNEFEAIKGHIHNLLGLNGEEK